MKIALTGGGTAGHVMPNLALLPELKKRFDGIYYIGGRNGIEKSLCEKYGVEFFATDTVKLDRSRFFSNIRIPFLLGKCVRQAKETLKELTPDVVFSKGGYVALPTCLAARSLGIPVVAHESDTTLGLANRITSRFAEAVVVSHKSTNAKNAVFIGNPLREELLFADGADVKRKYGLSQTKPLLLVIGGSSGSKALNDFIISILDVLLKSFCIIHITGKNGINPEKTKGLKNYFHKEYADDVFDLYAAADVVISRAGANTVDELTAIGKRVLYIPLPADASRGDQILNAKRACANGKAAYLEQKDLCEKRVVSTLSYLMSSPPPQPERNRKVNFDIAELLLNIASGNK